MIAHYFPGLPGSIRLLGRAIVGHAVAKPDIRLSARIRHQDETGPNMSVGGDDLRTHGPAGLA
jgi:hypothetical protein